MARIEKGTRPTGRQKGTPNKVTTMTKEVIARLLGEYQSSGLMMKDFKSLEPRDRLMVSEKMMQYVMPKIQAVQMEATVKENTLAETLRKLAEEAGG